MVKTIQISILFLILTGMLSCSKNDDLYDELVPRTVTDNADLPSFTLSDGTKLHLKTYGNPQKPMILVLHGGPGGDFKGLLSLSSLGTNFFVVFFDQRGTGLSQRLPKEQLTPPFLLNDISEIIKHFSPNKPIYLIGHSWGGALATYFVQQYPDKITKLLLLEPGALNSEAAKVANTTVFAFSSKELHQLLNSNDFLGYENNTLADYKMAIFNSSDIGDYRDFADPSELKKLVYNRFGFLAGYAVNEWQGNFDQTYHFDFAIGIKENFKGKTLIIAADKSQRLGYAFQEKYHKPLFKNCEIFKVENAGHYFVELNSEKVIPFIESFLK